MFYVILALVFLLKVNLSLIASVLIKLIIVGDLVFLLGLSPSHICFVKHIKVSKILGTSLLETEMLRGNSYGASLDDSNCILLLIMV